MGQTLDAYLNGWAAGDPGREAVAATVAALARGCADIAELVADGPLAGPLGAARGVEGGGGDDQKELDVRTDEMIVAALRGAPVAAYASEEAEAPLAMTPGAPLLVATDPLDGSSNIEVDVTIGTIFSILPAPAGIDPASEAAFLQPGHAQLAAGYALYGPHTALVFSVGEGCAHFVLDRKARQFVLVERSMAAPAVAREFAINMSNRRHWDERMQLYVDDLQAGRDGPREVDYNMRWVGSMVAEAHRILVRGGIYLYPADSRPGYGEGRLRLLYEAFPIAMLMVAAGAGATDGERPILDLTPKHLHQRTPLVFGSADKVRRVAAYMAAPSGIAERSPLFAKRSLLTD